MIAGAQPRNKCEPRHVGVIRPAPCGSRRRCTPPRRERSEQLFDLRLQATLLPGDVPRDHPHASRDPTARRGAGVASSSQALGTERLADTPPFLGGLPSSTRRTSARPASSARRRGQGVALLPALFQQPPRLTCFKVFRPVRGRHSVRSRISAARQTLFLCGALAGRRTTLASFSPTGGLEIRHAAGGDNATPCRRIHCLAHSD